MTPAEARRYRERLVTALAEKQKREALDVILPLLRELPEPVRAEVMGEVATVFCRFCWTEDPDCQCWNDE